MSRLSTSDAAILRRQIKRAKRLEYLGCRVGADGHRWQRCQPDFTPEYGEPAVWQCDVCDCIKRQVHTKKGELLASEYEYPDGYLYRSTNEDSRMERLFTPQAVRAAYFERIQASLNSLPVVRPITQEGGDTTET